MMLMKGGARHEPFALVIVAAARKRLPNLEKCIESAIRLLLAPCVRMKECDGSS
jgi:hypothetical protein